MGIVQRIESVPVRRSSRRRRVPCVPSLFTLPEDTTYRSEDDETYVPSSSASTVSTGSSASEDASISASSEDDDCSDTAEEE